MTRHDAVRTIGIDTDRDDVVGSTHSFCRCDHGHGGGGGGHHTTPPVRSIHPYHPYWDVNERTAMMMMDGSLSATTVGRYSHTARSILALVAVAVGMGMAVGAVALAAGEIYTSICNVSLTM